jgi:DNA-binding SARP family transcriptional activator
MTLAKVCLPFPSTRSHIQPALEQALLGNTTMFTAPAGYVLTSHLSGLLQEQRIPTIWLSAEEDDRDPAALLLSLAAGAEANFPQATARTRERMRQHPGPVYGWTPLYAEFARNLAEAVAGSQSHSGLVPLSVVLQHTHLLYDSPETFGLLKDVFLPLLPSSSARLLIGHEPPPRGWLPGYVVQQTTQNLRLSDADALLMAQESMSRSHHGGAIPLSLPLSSIRRLVGLSEGCPTVLHGVCLAYPLLGGQVLQNLLESATNRVDLMARVAQCCIQTGPLSVQSTAALAMRLHYIDSDLVKAALGTEAQQNLLHPLGWLQPLVGGALRLDCTWEDPLRRILHPESSVTSAMLKLSARHLVQAQSYSQAIPLLLDLGSYDQAAEAILQVIETMIDLGQWDQVGGWLKRLPEKVRHNWPGLIYAEGELAAARGQSRSGRKLFAAAARAYGAQGDQKGACQSMLSESILAARQNDLTRAGELATEARLLAQQTEQNWLKSWSAWQMACLAACTGQMNEAAALLHSAAQTSAGQEQLSASLTQARDLVQNLVNLQQQVHLHQQAAKEAELAGQDATEQLRYFFQNPAEKATGLLGQFGWSKVPLSVKLPASYAPLRVPAFLSGANNSLVDRVIESVRAMFLVESMAAPPEPRQAAEAAHVMPVQSSEQPMELEESSPARQMPPIAEMEIAAPVGMPEALKEPRPERLPVTINAGLPRSPLLNAYLLGQFRVTINDVLVGSWTNARSRSIFAFMLLHNGQPVPRDALMETFWPEASAESARNSLNVAIYVLRHHLANAVDFPMILFHENTYRINPDVQLWTDIAEFAASVRNARLKEIRGEGQEAVHEYEQAVSLYQGDFLSDSLFEDWTAVERERLRVLHLDTLDHLSLVYFNLGQYAACISLCQRILSHDSCREDAHCQLMRSYSRQGQVHLALRQYQACVESLRSELDVEPSPVTVQLYEHIRSREMV